MTYKTYRTYRGFTLIEVVVGIGIFALLAVSGSLLLMAILRGAAKARAQALVRSEGAAALGVIDRFIRSGQRVSACSADGSSLTVVDPAGQPTTFTCQSDSLASNSARLTSTSVQVNDCGGVFTCDFPPPLTRQVIIRFGLARSGVQLPIETAARADFQSQVGLRN